ncbi:MAG: PmbA/TldA family metallopeptidase [[Clostridium] innocuum]
MLEKNILEDVLEIACSTTGDFAEIFEEINYSTRISMLNDEVESTNSGIRCGLGLRIYHGLESEYGYTNDTEEKNLKEFAKSWQTVWENRRLSTSASSFRRQRMKMHISYDAYRVILP